MNLRQLMRSVFIILFFFFSLLWANKISAQNTIVVSTTSGPLYIGLDWSAFPNAKGYNIFRKAASASNYPSTPINSTPIIPVSTCNPIRSLLINGLDSTNWNLVARGLGDSVLFNPCNVNTPGLNAVKAERLLLLAKSILPIAEVVGTGYEDHGVISGSQYLYEVVALNSSGNAIGVVDTNLGVTAGAALPLPAPTGLVTEAGDAMNQIMWKQVIGAEGYEVQRSVSSGGPFVRVNSSTFSASYTHHLNGDTLIPAEQGYVDFQVYDNLGKPSTHLVAGVSIDGPDNGTKYYYRVMAMDFFNRPGNLSSVSLPTTPKDTTPPAVAGNLLTAVDNIHGYVHVTWSQVTKDIKGRWEEPDSSISYSLYRFTSESNPTNSSPVLVTNINPRKGMVTIDTTDTYSGLRAQFGNRTWWYRIRCIDARGFKSGWSAAVSAIVKDTTAPAIPTGLIATGFPDHISLKWDINTEPDMSSYMIYRSLCHLGAWVPCSNLDTCRSWYGAAKNNDSFPASRDKGRFPCPCSGAFDFLGSITQDSAKRARSQGHVMYNDFTVPAGSPLCYAYWIKAKDSSENQSGSFPVPSPAEKAQIVCVHLHDTTPPEPAVITGMNALNNSIFIQWIGPPSQDIRAYHLYRAIGLTPGQEPPVGNFVFAGGMTVELPPKLPQILTTPYVPPHVLPCDSIPVQAMPWMSQGQFVDQHVKPKLTYWYRVTGIDYAGNETALSKAAPLSSFTFSLNLPAVPKLDTLLTVATPCSVEILWTTTIPVADQVGVIVYRSNAANGIYSPIVTAPVAGNSFSDVQVVHGQVYYYKIAILVKTGQLSNLSSYKSITP
jgi:fibronectin type 3 domain-containing protein